MPCSYQQFTKRDPTFKFKKSSMNTSCFILPKPCILTGKQTLYVKTEHSIPHVFTLLFCCSIRMTDDHQPVLSMQETKIS